jgi:hypothetical protein
MSRRDSNLNSACERPQTHALDRAATVIGYLTGAQKNHRMWSFLPLIL